MSISDPRKEIVHDGRLITIIHDSLDQRLEITDGRNLVIVSPSYDVSVGFGYAVHENGLHSIEASPEQAIDTACKLLKALDDRADQDLWLYLSDHYINLPGPELNYDGSPYL